MPCAKNLYWLTIFPVIPVVLSLTVKVKLILLVHLSALLTEKLSSACFLEHAQNRTIILASLEFLNSPL